MVQAIVNNTDILTKVDQYMTNPQSKNILNDTDKTGSFEEVFTLGDFKNMLTNTKDNDNLANFRKILEEATGEANVETALDLTLARDINEIIEQLQNVVSNDTKDIDTDTTSETDDETVDANVDFEAGIVITDEETTDTTETARDNSDKTALNNKQNETNTNTTKDTVTNVLTSMLNKETALNNEALKQADLPSLSKPETITLKNDVIELTSDAITDDSAKVAEGENIADGETFGLDDEALKELNIENIGSESDFAQNSGSDLANQSPEEHAVRVMLNEDAKSFDVKLETASTLQSTPKAVSTNASKIIEQVVKQMENLHNTSKVNIVLNPEKLGKVTIQLAKSAEGMTAQFTVATQEAREVLSKGLQSLREGLLSHGVNVDNVSVKVADSQKSEYKQDWTEQEGSRGGNKEQGKSNKEKDKGLFDKLMAQHQSDEENG